MSSSRSAAAKKGWITRRGGGGGGRANLQTWAGIKAAFPPRKSSGMAGLVGANNALKVRAAFAGSRRASPAAAYRKARRLSPQKIANLVTSGHTRGD